MHKQYLPSTVITVCFDCWGNKVWTSCFIQGSRSASLTPEEADILTTLQPSTTGNINPFLSSLVNYIQPVPFQGFEEAEGKATWWCALDVHVKCSKKLYSLLEFRMEIANDLFLELLRCIYLKVTNCNVFVLTFREKHIVPHVIIQWIYWLSAGKDNSAGFRKVSFFTFVKS